MVELKKFKIFLPVLFILIFIMFFILIIGVSSGDASQITGEYFSMPFDSEISYTITSKFGYRIDPINKNTIGFHSGIDFAIPKGTSILSSASGIVAFAGTEVEGGWCVVIEHKFEDVTYQTYYAHMEEESLLVQKGEYVMQGQPIGKVGNTGTRTTGLHLHFSIYSPDRSGGSKNAIDPINIFK